jgi:DNA-binding transcriptional ArsR family regulator
MASNARFAEVAAIAGDPTRAGMLHALMDGRALTASELAHVAGIAPQTASGHLARMTAVGILIVEKQGRHRYHRLATAAVAHMLESIMQVASELEPARKLAGQLGVALADALVAAGHAELASDGGIVTDTGVEFLGRIGIDVTALRAQRARKSGRVLCRPCLDWSERRPHLAGMVGSAICTHSFDMGWIRRSEGTRAVLITPKGQRVFREEFGLQLT